MFGDEDLAFDLHDLETFGVDIAALKEPAFQRIFRAYVEVWEQDDQKKNDCVAEARLLVKYKGLLFVDLDTGKTFSVYMRRIWSFVGVETMDGLCLLYVRTRTTAMTMRHSHWTLLAK